MNDILFTAVSVAVMTLILIWGNELSRVLRTIVALLQKISDELRER